MVHYSLWILKYAILEFFRRLNVNWRRSYELSLLLVRAVLITTFVAVLISDLAECQPFSNYWQVLPDPGGQCRQGYAQLLTMAVCNVVTDLLLVIFPVPVILGSHMSAKRKFQLVLLFSLSVAPVVVTIYRVPRIIQEGGSQQVRSLYASIELLFATAAANALVLGSFVRDRGVKKRRFKYDSIAAGSLERSSASESRRPTVLRHWGSDEDLARDLGYGLTPELRDRHLSPGGENRTYVPAGVVKLQDDMNTWQFPSHPNQKRASSAERSDDPAALNGRPSSSTNNPHLSFFDYGGLLDDPNSGSQRESYNSSDQSTTPIAQPEPTLPATGMASFRRGSAALLQDLGGFLTPYTSGGGGGSKNGKQKQKPKTTSATQNNGRTEEYQPVRQQETTGSREASRSPPAYEESNSAGAAGGKVEPELMDVGGLLGGPSGR